MISENQLEEFLKFFPEAEKADEGGITYFFLPKLALPAGCTPQYVDALLCTSLRDGYQSRLFFTEAIKTPSPKTWTNNRIFDKNWFVYSWQTSNNLSLLQKILVHINSLTE